MTSIRPSQADSVAISTSLTQNDSLAISLCADSTRLDSSTQHLTMRLLQPLANPSMLASCREASSSSTNNIHNTDPETLALSALDKAWRKVTSNLYPPSSITFDLSLPKPESSFAEFRKIYWDTSTPSSRGQHATSEPATSCGLQQVDVKATPVVPLLPLPRDERDIAVVGRDVMRIVNGIATATRVRKQGEEVWFNVVYNEGDGISARMVKLLESQLGWNRDL